MAGEQTAPITHRRGGEEDLRRRRGILGRHEQGRRRALVSGSTMGIVSADGGVRAW
jgi:hypothetical protein